jgi:hypothetical protein
MRQRIVDLSKENLLLNPEAQEIFRKSVRCLRRTSSPDLWRYVNEILMWFNAADDLESIPFDFVFETPWSSLMFELIVNVPPDLLCIPLRIAGYLTSKPEQIPVCFLNNDFFGLICRITVESASSAVICHSLIVISQILLGFHDSNSVIDVRNVIEPVIDRIINLDSSDSAAIAASSYFLCVCYRILHDVETSSLVGFLLKTLSVGEELSSLYVLKGLILIMPDVASILLESDYFLNICLTLFEKRPNISLHILRCLLQLVEIGVEQILVTHFIFAIANSPIVSPDFEDSECFDACATFVSNLLLNANSWIRISESCILHRFCNVAVHGCFNLKITAFAVLQNAIHVNNPGFARIIAQDDVIASLCDVLENSEKDFAEIVMAFLVELMRAAPDASLAIFQGLKRVLGVWEDEPEFMQLYEMLLSIHAQ